MAIGEKLRRTITNRLGVISVILLIIYAVIAVILCDHSSFEPLDMINAS